MVRPIRRAGSRNSGISTSDSSVICHEILSMTTSVSVSVTMLVTTPEKRVGEGALRADHVVAEPADQCAGAGAGEERDRHPLHVVEHRGAQVEDQALADGRRQPAGHQRHAGLGDGDRRDHRGQRHDHAERAAVPISSTTLPASSGVATASSALTTLTATNTPSLR